MITEGSVGVPPFNDARTCRSGDVIRRATDRSHGEKGFVLLRDASSTQSRVSSITESDSKREREVKGVK